MRTWLWVSVALAVSPVLHAGAIYTCEKDGRKVFSQVPCGSDAVVVDGGDAPVTVSRPMKSAEITRLCKLAIKARDRAASEQEAASYRPVRRYSSQYRAYGQSAATAARDYFLTKITNLEQLASRSPSTYEMLKGLTDRVSYQGYGDSPVYNAERAAALTKCEDYVDSKLNRGF